MVDVRAGGIRPEVVASLSLTGPAARSPRHGAFHHPRHRSWHRRHAPDRLVPL